MPDPAPEGERLATEQPTHQRWLEACRGAVEAQRAILDEHRGIAGRTVYEGVGEGGDRTLVIDRLCEDAVFAELERLHDEGYEFTAIAEERGGSTFGGGGETRVVIDPIDGSLNARRTVPAHCLSVGVAEGDSMADVHWGYVYDFGPGEEFIAARGEGATLDGEPLEAFDGPGLELVALEASKPERVIAACERLAGRAYRIRSPGAIAISLSYVGASRFDGMITTRPCRSVDAAAAQLIATEAGASVRFGRLEPSEAKLGLEARYHLAGAREPADLEILLDAQSVFD
jgi:myo-inositol-1(or 4)-monophosphatase